MVNFLNFEESDVGLWKEVKANWALALREALPKNLDEYKRLLQNELFFHKNGDPASLINFNFIQHLQWNNMGKEIDAIPDCIFQIMGSKGYERVAFSKHGKEFIFHKFYP